MPFEPWFVFPPEVNARRLQGHSGGALQAGAKYQNLATRLATDAVTFLGNMKELFVVTPGQVGDAIMSSGTKQAKYVEGQAAKAAATGAQLAGVGNAAMVARATLIPEYLVAQNRAIFKEAAANSWWSPPAAAVATAAGATYAVMWTVNALAGTGFDAAAAAGSQPIPMMTPLPSLPGGVRGVPSVPKALMPEKMITNSPAISSALRDSQSVAKQLITPVDGVRAGGLGSGRGMPQVAGNPGAWASRGGIPTLDGKSAMGSYPGAGANGLLGSTHTSGSNLSTLPSYSPSGSGMAGGMPVGTGMAGTGARSGIGSLSFNHQAGSSGSLRIGGGGGARGMRAAGTGSGLGSGSSAGAGTGAGTGAGAGAGTPGAAVRGGALGGSAGMNAEKALGGRMGPAYSGVSATDKTLTTVGNQTRAGTTGAMGPGMAGRRGGHATEEKAGQVSYIAKEVSFESLEKKRAFDKKQRDLFD